jgi:hypothetical protein
MKKNKYEKAGLIIEILGMLILVIATVWDNNFSGWWDKQSSEWQYRIQEEMNLDMMYAMQKMVVISSNEDVQYKKQVANDTHSELEKAARRAIEERDARRRALNGQAELFSTIKVWLFILGTICVVLGKGIFLVSYYKE